MIRRNKKLTLAIMACAAGLAVMQIGLSAARADDNSDAAMQAKIDQLEKKVAALEDQQLVNEQAENAAIQQVMQDANSHSQLMAGSMGAGSGYDAATGFHLGSDDGNFYLHPFALFQFRGVGEYRDAVQPGDTGADVPQTGSHSQSGFEIRHLELGLDGHLYTPNLGYYFLLETARSGGGLSLDDAYVTYRLGDKSPFTVKAGQFEDIAWHESSLGDGMLMAADRSLMDALIGGTLPGFGNTIDRVQGVSLIYQQDAIHGEAAFHDGYNSANTKFFDVSPAAGFALPENFGISGRFQYKILGDDAAWSEYNQFTALGDKSELLVAGAGFDWTEAGDNDALFWTFDAQYDNPNGLGLYGAFEGQYTAIPHAGLAIPAGYYNNYGFLLQASYVIQDKYEPFLRYDFTHLDGNYGTALGATEHNIHEISLGVNYYLYGQNAKVTLDGTWLPNGSPEDADGLGFLKDDGKNELVARLQFQLKI